MQKWEYKVIKVHRVSWEDADTKESIGRHEETGGVFNSLGQQGWELAATGFDANGNPVTAVFKRAVEG